MIPLQSKWIVVIALVLMLGGYALTWLMVLQMVPSTFFLNFFAYGAMTGGLFLGAIGLATWMSNNRRQR